jgi:AcrR family transcriptional regulator
MMSPAKRSVEDASQLRSMLIEHARALVARDGAAALTMRALATEAGCAVGLPYKVFADRREIVAAVVHADLERLGVAFDELLKRAGSRTVGTNLTWFATVLLDSPAVALAQELLADETLRESVNTSAHDRGIGPAAFPRIVADYLAAEQRAGHVAPGVDTDAFGFLIASSLHNLLIAGEAWPRPTRRELQRILSACAKAIGPTR